MKRLKEAPQSQFEQVKRELRVVQEQLMQARPYTLVALLVEHNGKYYSDFAFSHVSWPDKWSAMFGYELAKDRAKSKIAGLIVENSNGKK